MICSICSLLLFDRRRHSLGGVHRRLGGIDGGHDVGAGGGVQSEGPGDPGHFSCGEHQSQPQQQVFPECQEARRQDGGLEERRQAQADDLLHPLEEPVRVAARHAEHVEAPHRNLDEQDAAPFQICKKYFYHGVSHGDHAEDQHDRTGEHGHHEVRRAGHVTEAGHGGEVLHDLPSHLSNAGPQSGDLRGELPLQGHGQFIQPHRDGGEQADRQEALHDVQRRLLDTAPSGGVIQTKLKTADHHADAEQRPAQLAEKCHDGLHPGQLEEFHAHHAHDGEEVPQEPHELSIEPVHEIAHDRVRYKIPDKDLCHLRFPALTRRHKLVRMIARKFAGAAHDL